MAASRLIGSYPVICIRPASWNAFGMDKEGQDFRACAAYGPMYKTIR